MRKTIIAAATAAVAALTLAGCGTQTHEEIRVINGVEVLCTWTVEPFEPWTKNDYRCDPTLRP